jgi:hypothetical protein
VLESNLQDNDKWESQKLEEAWFLNQCNDLGVFQIQLVMEGCLRGDLPCGGCFPHGKFLDQVIPEIDG